MPSLRYALVLLLSLLTVTASAQDHARGRPLAGGVAPEPFPPSFEAPDRNQPTYRSVQATFTVTTAADSGPGSLREAIEMANETAGLDAIEFEIDGGGSYAEIFLDTRLPYVTDPVTIDGDTQGCDTGGGPCIRLDGETLVDVPDEPDGGLILLGGGSTVHGLLFTRFYREDTIVPALRLSSGGSTVTGCYFGTDRTGMITDPDGTPDSGDELGNGFGISVYNFAEFGSPAVDNVVGGATAEERNVVAGSTLSGIILQGKGVEGNLIVGNYIGTNAAGTAALGNGQSGIVLFEGADSNTVQDNLVSGNIQDGITIEGGASNTITGNFIGTNAAGTAAIPNGTPAGLAELQGIGMSVLDGAGNLIEDNLISGNLLAGVVLGAAFVGPEVTGNTVRANRIGTDVTSTQPLPNGIPGVDDIGFGIAFFAIPGVTVSGNTVGGDSYEDANVIGFNTTAGIGAEGPGVTGNVIDHNYVGVTPQLAPIPNGLLGVLFRGFANGNRIGSATAGDAPSGNVIGYQPIGVGLGEGTIGNEVAANMFVGAPGAFLPIDLGLDGPTANDPNDPDDGPHRLQNAPIVESASASGNELTVTFSVDTAPANAAYPLTVRFFEREVSDGVMTYTALRSASYAENSAGQPRTVTLTLPSGGSLGAASEVVATATDADGNTGEASLMGSTVPTEPTAGPRETHEVSAAFPNPFRSSTQFTLAVTENQRIVVELYDALGRRVATLLDEPVAGGTPRPVRIEEAGLPSGTYLVRVTGEQFEEVHRITLLR